MKPRYKWKPMQRANALRAASEALIAETMRHYNIEREAALKLLNDDAAECEFWINDIYQVEVRWCPEDDSAHLNIRRRDGGPILRDWRHFQSIKNEIVGEECEAVELYPAESRKVDTSNKFHLWCCTDPAFRFPFGFKKRDVQFKNDDSTAGLRQRPL